MAQYSIRTMTRGEIDLAVEWAAQEGWNPGWHDADSFFAADPDGFLVGLLDGEPIASISVVRYGDHFGFLGFYIVKPAYRGRGYGLRIWQAGLDRLSGRTIGLDGVVAQQDAYRKSGFQWAYSGIRHQGEGGGPDPRDADVVPLSSISFDEVLAVDRAFFLADRTAFVRSWIAPPGGAALGLREGHALTGYGVLRACRMGYKIGPLFAKGPDQAERLFLAMKAHVPRGAPMYLDVPSVNEDAMHLVQRHRMTPVFETARMYRGSAPDLPVKRIFGVTTFELG